MWERGAQSLFSPKWWPLPVVELLAKEFMFDEERSRDCF